MSTHIEKAERFALQAVQELQAGHNDTAQSCATVATAFATLALATRGRAKMSRGSEQCQYAANHAYMAEPCPLCGWSP